MTVVIRADIAEGRPVIREPQQQAHTRKQRRLIFDSRPLPVLMVVQAQAAYAYAGRSDALPGLPLGWLARRGPQGAQNGTAAVDPVAYSDKPDH